MSAPFVGDTEDLNECSSCCRHRGSYMSATLVTEKEELI